jgi:hypothetical protein
MLRYMYIASLAITDFAYCAVRTKSFNVVKVALGL